MKKHLLILLVLLWPGIILSQNKSNNANQYRPYPFLQKISKVKTLVNLLNDSLGVEEKHIGFARSYSKTYATFERLRDLASNNTLVSLLHHANAKVRVYAFWALSDKNKSLALNHAALFRNDTTTVSYFSGCIKSVVAVNRIALMHLENETP